MSFELFKQSFLTGFGYTLAFVTTMKLIEVTGLFKNNYTDKCEGVKEDVNECGGVHDGVQIESDVDGELVSKPRDFEYKKLLDKMSRY